MTSSAWFQTLVAMPRSERSALCWKASKQTKNGRQGRPVCCLLRCDSNLAVAFTEEHSVRVSPCKSQCIDLSTRECTPAQSFGWLIKSSFQCTLFLCLYLLVCSIANTLAWVRNGDRWCDRWWCLAHRSKRNRTFVPGSGMERGSSSAAFLAGVARALTDQHLQEARAAAFTLSSPPDDFAAFRSAYREGGGDRALQPSADSKEAVEVLSEYEQQRLAKIQENDEVLERCAKSATTRLSTCLTTRAEIERGPPKHTEFLGSA